MAVSVAPIDCPVCHGSVWEYHPPEADPRPGREDDSSGSFEMVARSVIGSDSVRRWRFDQLQRAGYAAADALVLSGRSDVDLHQATRLLDERCTVATALEILI